MTKKNCLPPGRATFLVLQSPVDREKRSQHLKLIPRHKHFVDLRIPRVTVADEALVMLRIVIGCNEKWFVEKLKVGD